MMTLDAITDAALQLPEEDRKILGMRLDSSLSHANETSPELIAECEAMIDAIDRGEIEVIDWKDVRAELVRDFPA